MIYRFLADALLLVHLAFILFVVAGGLLALKWPRISWIHLPAAAWGALIELGGWVCPLTPLENRLRTLGGGSGYPGGFIETYLVPVIYPPGLTHAAQLLLGAGVIVTNLAIYGVLLFLLRRRRQQAGSSPSGIQPLEGSTTSQSGRFGGRLRWSKPGPWRAGGDETSSAVLPPFLVAWLDHLDLEAPLSEEIERLLAEQLSLPPAHEFERQAHAAAETTHALPVAFEAGGCFLLRSSGEVLWSAWDNEAVPEPEESLQLQWQALRSAARTYPGLRSLAPPRPDEAVACTACGGRGSVEEGGGPKEDCSGCWGLGWGVIEDPRSESASMAAGNRLQDGRERVEPSQLEE